MSRYKITLPGAVAKDAEEVWVGNHLSFTRLRWKT